MIKIVNIRCSGCGTTKDESNFYQYKTSAGNISRRKTCNKCRSRQTMNTPSYKKAHEKFNEKVRQRKRDIIARFGNRCGHCKNSFPPCVFDFHHINPDEKDYNIAGLLRRFKDDALDKELEKCIMLCSNCHRIEHYKGD